jgi:diguanylate cyclase (GGDEF)-like protein
MTHWLRVVHSPEHLTAKTEGLAGFSVVATVITAVFVATTWIWDYAIDPVHAVDAFWLRMAEAGAVLALAGIMARDSQGLGARAGLILVPVFVEITFMEVLARLDGGASFGMGGFLYFFIFVPFMALAQSLRFNVLLLAFIALFPNVMRMAGIGAALDLGIYNAYVWMVYPPVIMILVLVESLFRQIYTHHDELHEHATRDALTGALNRRHFVEQCNQELARRRHAGEPVSLLFVDADNFKAVNDQYGHRCGDQVLQILARRIRQMVRTGDIVARYGGEEFVIMMPNASLESAREIAERLRRHVAAYPIRAAVPEGALIEITVSIGIATFATGHSGSRLRELMQAADDALYNAKRAGRNRVEVWAGA